MLSINELRVLVALTKGAKSSKELAEELDVSLNYISTLGYNLRGQKLIKTCRGTTVVYYITDEGIKELDKYLVNLKRWFGEESD